MSNSMGNYILEILEYQIIDGIKTLIRESNSNLGNALYLNGSLGLKVTGKEINLHNMHGKNLWDKPIVCSGIPHRAYQSANRILLTTLTKEYHAWGFLGPAILIDIDAGVIIREIRGEHGSPLSDGRFIVGLEGYDVFDSWLYDKNGEIVQTWRSYGHYVIDEFNNIRVIEQDRREPTQSHVVNLRMDGSIEKGEKLITSRASKPVLTQNNDIIFENSGILRIINSGLKEVARYQLLEISNKNAWRFTSNLKLIGQNHLLINIFERSDGKSSPIKYRMHQWLMKLK